MVSYTHMKQSNVIVGTYNMFGSDGELHIYETDTNVLLAVSELCRQVSYVCLF